MTRAVVPAAPALTVEEAGGGGLQVHPLPDIPVGQLWPHSLSHSLLCFLCSSWLVGLFNLTWAKYVKIFGHF